MAEARKGTRALEMTTRVLLFGMAANGTLRPRDPTFRLTKDQIDFLNAQYQGEPLKKKTRPHEPAKGTTALPGDACGLRPRAFLIFLCRFKCLHFATQLHNIEEVSEECRTKEAAV